MQCQVQYTPFPSQHMYSGCSCLVSPFSPGKRSGPTQLGPPQSLCLWVGAAAYLRQPQRISTSPPQPIFLLMPVGSTAWSDPDSSHTQFLCASAGAKFYNHLLCLSPATVLTSAGRWCSLAWRNQLTALVLKCTMGTVTCQGVSKDLPGRPTLCSGSHMF